MDSTKCTQSNFLALVGLMLFLRVSSQHFFVTSPNTFRIGEKETVAVYLASGLQEVSVSLANYTDKNKPFFSKTLNISADKPEIFEVQVNPEDIPDLNITGHSVRHYVYLMVNGTNFRKETKVLITLQSGYIFLQTDKPIYNPTHTVNIRVIRLDEDMVIDSTPFKLQIRNPQNTIVHSLSHKELIQKNGTFSTVFYFPKFPLYGEWSAEILYGFKVQLNSSVKFELREYVLPTFEINVKVPEVIFPDDEIVNISLTAEYVFGKKVDGIAYFVLKVKIPTGHQTEQFGSCEGKKLYDGKAYCNFNTTLIKGKQEIGWFPHIAGAKLVVEALVYERSSGYKENRTTDSTIFSSTPHVISFGKSLTTYIAGINTVVLAQINHVNGNPARNVNANISVLDQKGETLDFDSRNGVTNEEGLVAFVLKTKLNYTSLSVTVQTSVQNHSASGHLMLYPYKSDSNSYVGISRDTSTNVHKVGSLFTASLFCHPQQDMSMFYLVLSKGKILKAGSLLQMGTHQRSLNFEITPQMIPSARVVLFAIHNGQLLADSLKLRVEKICNPDGEVKVTVTSESNMEPGNAVFVTITGEENTVVGILAVDKAVYALRDKDRLTREKMFSEMEKHDMGCGAGGGWDSAAVLANAGVILMTDTLLQNRERRSCVKRILRKREIHENITQEHGRKNRECCKAGLLADIHKRTCEDRAEILRRLEEKKPNMKNCAKSFLACCLKALVKVHGRSQEANEQELDDNAIDGMLDDVRERKDFKETWLFDVDIIGPSKVLKEQRNLPDSITTWIVQVVGLSTKGAGMCVAEPFEVVVFKPLFLDVKVPYSVVTNEQIEIPVTVFNYGTQKQLVYVFTYGQEGLCSEAEPNKRSDKKTLTVGAKSSETLAFQIIPLKANSYPLKFSVTSSAGSDAVIKTLHVIHEGVPQEKSFYFTIDPSNTEKRPKFKRSINITNYFASFDTEQKKQTSIYTLEPDAKFVPGTEYVIIEAIGDKFGPSINTSLENPDALICLPQGCGEQTTAKTASTVFTMDYLKATGKITSEQEEKAYGFIRKGYNDIQTFRKADGSFSVFKYNNSPSSTWLTIFVAKVLCRARRYVFIDENLICNALKWVVEKQTLDGSFFESQNLFYRKRKGSIGEEIRLTSFALMAFKSCECKSQNLQNATAKAVKYLKDITATINDDYHLAISTYALALHDPELAKDPNEKLLQMSIYDHALNRRHWGDGNSARSVEASSYGLLTQVLLRERESATSIVNFLNSHRRIGGSYFTTQDTLAAIEALSEYAILSKDSDISLVVNISSKNDYNFKETWQFQNHNARVLRQAEIKRVGEKVYIEAEGSGAGIFGVRLRYNIASNPDTLCRFEVKVNVAENRKKKKEENVSATDENNFDGFLNKQKLHATGKAPFQFGNIKPESEFILGDDNIVNPDDLHHVSRTVSKREVGVQDQKEADFKSRKYVLDIEICCRYLGNENTSMAIVDVEMLTGFKPEFDDLKRLVENESSFINKVEELGRNLIFYLEKIPYEQKHCFSFRINREFIASNLKSGLVRVYDYYKPDDACSQFYRSPSKGPALRVNCVGKICKCAEGGCPLDPTERIRNVTARMEKPKEVAKMACSEYNYFFKVKVNSKKEETSGYLYYNVTIVKVLKEGREKKGDIEGEFCQLVARSECENSTLTVNNIYYLMGRDTELKQVDDKISCLYFIDQSSMVKEFVNFKYLKGQNLTREERIKNIQIRNIQIIFKEVELLFESNDGCDD